MLRALSWIPLHIGIWTGSNHALLAKLHRKYGHVVRVSPNELSWTDPEAWKDIYGHGTKGAPGAAPHKNWAVFGTSPNGGSSLVSARDDDHARMRKVFAPAFSNRALKQQEPLFLKYVDLLVTKLKEGLREDSNQKFDLVRLYNFTSFDIMGDLTFGEPLYMLEKAQYDPWVTAIFSGIRSMSRMAIIKMYPFAWKITQMLIPKTFYRKAAEHFQYSVTRVTKRLEKGREAKGVDLWDLVLKQESGKGLTRAEMDLNASLFMVGGTETTATVLSGLTYFILRSPECMTRLATEIRSAFRSEDEMNLESLAALPYLSACIREALRMYPPLPLGLPRIVPESGSTIAGRFVPPGTLLGIPHVVASTSEANFRLSNQFIPERWMGGKNFEEDKRHVVQPFSVGNRDCVGRK